MEESTRTARQGGETYGTNTSILASARTDTQTQLTIGAIASQQRLMTTKEREGGSEGDLAAVSLANLHEITHHWLATTVFSFFILLAHKAAAEVDDQG